MADAILEARGLWKSYPGAGRSAGQRRPALIDAALDLRRGEILGVVGESGSGKTTLARCLALLVRPDRGSVVLDGAELTRLTRVELCRERRRIQTVFQDPLAALNPRLRVGEAIAEVIRVHGLAPRRGVDARVAELLDLVALPRDAAGRYPAAFSGGQRQRVCIARALAAEPEVLIADEPVSALDVSIRAQILNLLADLRDRLGLSMVFIGHDLLVVEFIATRIAVMLGGQVVELMPPGAPLGQARHPYTRELLAAAPRITAAGMGGGGVPPPEARADAEEMPAAGCPYWGRCTLRADPRCGTEFPPLCEVAPQHAVASFCVTARLEAGDNPTMIAKAHG